MNNRKWIGWCSVLFFSCVGHTQTISLHPEPADWYSGDIHVHRNCGDPIDLLSESKLGKMMEDNDLSVISVLADMGNAEVRDSKTDLLNVTGKDALQSSAKRIIHWDTEWHWDATYSNFSNQALGGHLVLLGLKHAEQIWDESPYKILEWASRQHAVKGFAHMEYLNNTIQDTLNCCIPIDFPVEAALGNIDFVSEDVYGKGSPNNGNYNSEAAMQGYYKLLNCGFQLGLAAGTDYPCNGKEPLGKLLTYAQVSGKLTYNSWIGAIKKGRTVVSRNGHQEFLSLSLDGKAGPGQTVLMKNKKPVAVRVTWTADTRQSGHIELVCNGKVVATREGTADRGKPLVLDTTITVNQSSWFCARRMDGDEHQSHTSAAYASLNGKPVRASAADAEYFVSWIDNILANIEPGHKWNRYFTHDLQTVQARYRKAKNIYKKIAGEVIR